MNNNYLERVWYKRKKLMQNKNWRGQDPIEGFKFLTKIDPNLSYSNDNWNDLMISDFRELLESFLYDGEVEGFTRKSIPVETKVLGLKNSVEVLSNENVTITCFNNYTQPQFTIYLDDITAFSISWYKKRGKIDSFINLEYGQPITLREFTEILIALKLESEPSEDEDFRQD